MTEAVRITSRDNQHLKFARRVRDGKETGHIFIEGKRLCREALSSGVSIEQTFISSKTQDDEFANAVSSRSRLFVVDDILIDSIADTDSPQGIVMIARRPARRSIEELFQLIEGLPLWICLDKPSNPSNLGAVVRTADAAGARGIIITSNSADPYAPKALRSSMGSSFRLPIASAEAPGKLFAAARSRGIKVAAMAANGDCDYLDIDWTKPTLLVVGSEADGLSQKLIDAADRSVRIEMKKPVESLNLAVSAGVVVFEAKRQFRLANR